MNANQKAVTTKNEDQGMLVRLTALPTSFFRAFLHPDLNWEMGERWDLRAGFVVDF